MFSVKRQKTQATVKVALNETLETLETLEKSEEVNSHAHILLSKALQRVHDAQDFESLEAIENIVIYSCVDYAWMLFTFQNGPRSLLRGVSLKSPNFIHKLFETRMVRRNSLNSDTSWLTDLFGFYIPKNDFDQSAFKYSMMLKCAIYCIVSAPAGTTIIMELIDYMNRKGIFIEAVCPPELDDDYVDEDGDTVAGNNTWVCVILYHAPDMIKWINVEEDSERAKRWRKLVAKWFRDRFKAAIRESGGSSENDLPIC